MKTPKSRPSPRWWALCLCLGFALSAPCQAPPEVQWIKSLDLSGNPSIPMDMMRSFGFYRSFVGGGIGSQCGHIVGLAPGWPQENMDIAATFPLEDSALPDPATRAWIAAAELERANGVREHIERMQGMDFAIRIAMADAIGWPNMNVQLPKNLWPVNASSVLLVAEPVGDDSRDGTVKPWKRDEPLANAYVIASKGCLFFVMGKVLGYSPNGGWRATSHLPAGSVMLLASNAQRDMPHIPRCGAFYADIAKVDDWAQVWWGSATKRLKLQYGEAINQDAVQRAIGEWSARARVASLRIGESGHYVCGAVVSSRPNGYAVGSDKRPKGDLVLDVGDSLIVHRETLEECDGADDSLVLIAFRDLLVVVDMAGDCVYRCCR